MTALLSLAVADAGAQTPPPRPDFATAPGWAYVSAAKCWAHFPDSQKKLEAAFMGWSGKCTDQKISGTGTLSVATDLVITGQFENGELKTGNISWYGGMITYQGNFSDGALRGTGKASFADGSHYQGSFADDKFDGQGRWDLFSNVYYEGSFKNNVMYGKGTLTWPQGSIEADYNGWAPPGEVVFREPGKAPVTGLLNPPANIAASPITPPPFPAGLHQSLVAVAHFMVMPDGTVTDVHAYTTMPGKTGIPETLRLDFEKAVQAARFTPGQIAGTNVAMPWEVAVAYGQ
jgi:hypothetical protein